MSPLHLFRETTVKIQRWPAAWKILLCAIGAMALSVAVMGWHVRANLGYRQVPSAGYAKVQR
jgi:hypothetical protein